VLIQCHVCIKFAAIYKLGVATVAQSTLSEGVRGRCEHLHWTSLTTTQLHSHLQLHLSMLHVHLPLMARIRTRPGSFTFDHCAGCCALTIFLPDHPWYPPSWIFNAHPHKWLPRLDPPNAPPEPPSALQRVLNLLGVSGGAKGSRSKESVSHRKASKAKR
jgi:hypothetical protein